MQPVASRKPASRARTSSYICINDTDPVSLEDFADMTERERKQIVRIGPANSRQKKNCYTLDSIYNVVKTAVEQGVAPKDPLNPSHVLTAAELATIHKLMKANDPKYKPPVKVNANAGLELHIDVNPFYPTYYTIKIKKARSTRTLHDLGTVPGWVDVNHTGSTDYTSAVLMSNVRELWDRQRLIAKVTSNPQFLRRTVGEHWRQKNWLQNFIAVCNEVSEALR